MQLNRRRPSLLICNIDVTAFAAVMVALLGVFLLTSGVVTHPGHGIGADLPHVNHAISMRGVDREDAMLVTIARDDKVFFRSELINPSQLPGKIRESVSHGSEKEVYIRADAHAKYEWIAEVLNGVHSAGIEKIGFLVNESRTRVVPNPQSP